jgi:hypothetical protein
VAWVVAAQRKKKRKGTDRVTDRTTERAGNSASPLTGQQNDKESNDTREGRSATIITPLPCDNHLFFNSFWLQLAHSASPSPVMGYSQDHPVPSQDHSSFSTNGLRIPFSPMSHSSPHQSPRRLSPAIDEPSSLPSPSLLNGSERPPLPTRASTLGSESELDPKSYSDPSLPKHSRSEDLNHSSTAFAAPSPSFLTTSRPNTPGSSSRDRNQPSPSEHLGRRLSGASGSSHSTSSGLAETRPPTSVTSVSSSGTVS